MGTNDWSIFSFQMKDVTHQITDSEKSKHHLGEMTGIIGRFVNEQSATGIDQQIALV